MPETTLETEVAVLIERETLGEGVCDDGFDEDWASTVASKANPRRAETRKRGWRRPTMTMMVGGGRIASRETLERSVEERNGDKRLKESDGRL